jgi:hypothetical protein
LAPAILGSNFSLGCLAGEEIADVLEMEVSSNSPGAFGRLPRGESSADARGGVSCWLKRQRTSE